MTYDCIVINEERRIAGYGIRRNVIGVRMLGRKRRLVFVRRILPMKPRHFAAYEPRVVYIRPIAAVLPSRKIGRAVIPRCVVCFAAVVGADMHRTRRYSYLAV